MDGLAEPLVPISAVDPATFETWVQPHLSAMRRLAFRLAPLDHEDIVQESLMRAWKSFATFDDARGTPRSWLLTIVTNRSRSTFARRRPRTCPLPDDLVTEDARADADLERAIARLALRQRTAVTLHYLLGLPVTEVAEVMGCSVGTVKSTLSDARARLRRSLEDTP